MVVGSQIPPELAYQKSYNMRFLMKMWSKGEDILQNRIKINSLEKLISFKSLTKFYI